MTLQLNKAHFPVTALGPGRRIGLWFQGCSIGCPGCISRDTWAPRDGHETSIDELIAWCQFAGRDGFDGVTISGGEPFEQPEALLDLLKAFHGWRAEAGLSFDVLVYSGLPLRTLRRRHGVILGLLDAVVAEPYVARLAPGEPGLGSSNQKLTTLSERGRTVHAKVTTGSRRRIQVSVDDQAIWCIGVPLPGDMERLEALAQARGLEWRTASWRA
jgi:anaerobic ribonucleoside-triphosphate reductase activating protein